MCACVPSSANALILHFHSFVVFISDTALWLLSSTIQTLPQVLLSSHVALYRYAILFAFSFAPYHLVSLVLFCVMLDLENTVV